MNKSAWTGEKTNTSDLSLSQDKQSPGTSLISTAQNLTKRFVKAHEPTHAYQQALKREELQVYHDSQHNENEKNLIEVKKEEDQDLQERSESEQSAHEATQMVDNSSCCLEDTYEQRLSQEMVQPATHLDKDVEVSRQPEPVQQETMQEMKQVLQEVKQVVDEVRQEENS